MSGALKILPHYTYEDYVQWEGKWELIDGIPYAMSPAPIPKHQLIANSLGALLYIALKECGHCKAYQAIDYKIKEDTIFQPDILILCKEVQKRFLDFAPSLIVEILSAGSVFIDRHTKFHAYQEQGVPYYIIVSPETEETEIYVLENGEYKLSTKEIFFSYSFRLDQDCEMTVDFGELWK